MDLLGSIMSSMDKPPSTVTEEQKKRNQVLGITLRVTKSTYQQERKRQMQKWKQMEDQRISQFKKKIRTRLDGFLRDSSSRQYRFEPMSQIDRAIVRDIVDDAGLTAFSFGEEEVDRHLIVWKREFAPCDDELVVIRNGGEWTEEKGVEIKRKRQAMESEKCRKPTPGPAPKSDYRTKYDHLVPNKVGKEAACDITANKQYGNVPLENKKDKRTIEETLAERRAMKQREAHKTDTPSTSANVTQR